MATASEIRDRFPHADFGVIYALAEQSVLPMDPEDDYTPCPRCKAWHLADGLPVPMCWCGYCRHSARTGTDAGFVCDFCGELEASNG